MSYSSQKPLAHVSQDKAGAFHEHLLTEHLYEVKRLAGQFAQEFGNSDWAGLAGLELSNLEFQASQKTWRDNV